MSRQFGRVAACFVLAATCFAVSAQSGESNARAVEDVREFMSRLDEWGFDGVLLLARGDDVLISQGYGLANRETGLAWGPDVISSVGSITKQFTAAAVLKLEERGKLNTDDVITKYFDAVPADKRGITIHQLLTHSSGIVDLDGVGDFDPIGREEFVERAMEQALEFAPGTRYEYSNAGYSLLGAIIEQLTGATYEKFLHEEFFEPLGMKHTGYIMMASGPERLAHAYNPDGSDWGTVIERPMATDGPYWVLRANGGIHSTANDMLIWARALMGGQVLSEQSMEKLWYPHVDESNGARSSFYGYGWAIHELPGGLKVITHNGGNGYHGADLMIIPREDLVLFAQSNVLRSTRLVFEILQPIGKHLLMGLPLPEVPQIADNWQPPAGLQSGRYESTEGGAIDVVVEDTGVALKPMNQRGFLAVHGAGDFDEQVLADCADRIDRAFEAIARGDYALFAALYAKAMDPAEVKKGFDEVMRQREASAGTFKRARVIGAAGDEGHIDVQVVFEHERDEFVVNYVFEPQPELHLAGRHGSGGLKRELRFKGSADGGLVTFNDSDFSSIRVGVSESGGTAVLDLNGTEFRR